MKPPIGWTAHRRTQLPAWNRDEFAAQLYSQGRAYHSRHPYDVLLDSGAAGREQIRSWVANWFYYQINVPVKDAVLLANCPDPDVRRNWIDRVLEHDASGDDPWDIEAWLRLAQAAGLTRQSVQNFSRVLPGVRFAVDAYVNFACRTPWQEAVCFSLIELFAPEFHTQRMAHWQEHYPWIDPGGLRYFQRRTILSRRDAEFGLAFILDHFDTRALQERAIEILKFKLDVLWQMSDALAQGHAVAVPLPRGAAPSERYSRAT